MEHQDLIDELPTIDSMNLTERIELAKKRRRAQIVNYNKWNEVTALISDDQKSKKIKFSADIQLTEAVSDGNLHELKDLLDKGINPNCTTYEGLTPLHHSCIEGNLDIVHLLLLRGADVNARDSDGWTPLHAAATCGHKEIVELLTRMGADLLALNEDGDMAFQITDDEDTLYFLEKEMLSQGFTEKMSEEMRQANYLQFKKDVQRTIRDGGDVDAPVTSNNGSFLHVAISHFYNDVVKLLLNKGASDTVQDVDGWRPIHVAAYWENMNAVELLVKHRNTDLNAVTKNGDRPYDLCDDSSCRIYIIRILNRHTMNNKANDSLTNIEPNSTKKYHTEEITAEENLKSNTDGITNVTVKPNLENTFLNSSEYNSNNAKEIKLTMLFKPTANEIGTERKSAAIRGAKKHAPLIRAQSFERNKDLDNSYSQDEILASITITQLDSVETKENDNLIISLKESIPKLKELTPHLKESSVKLYEDKKLKEIKQSLESKPQYQKYISRDVSSEDLLGFMLRLPNNETNYLKNNSPPLSSEVNNSQNMNQLDSNVPNLIRGPATVNSKYETENQRRSQQKGTNQTNKNEGKSTTNSRNEHKVLKRLTDTSSMREASISENSLYNLKQKRINERNNLRSKSKNLNVTTTPNQSNSEVVQHNFKQFETKDSRRDPTIFKKSNRCYIM